MESDREDGVPAGQVIGEEKAKEAMETLRRYRRGKANLEKRIVEDELWWELRHWEAVGRGKKRPEGANWPERPLSSSAWLFSAITSKHADAMDNYPEPLALPRERSDEPSAETISAVLPVVLEQCGFEQTYSDEWWEKLKHGTAVYSVLWDPDRENGLGDIAIEGVDLLKLFWEPGIEDLQDSPNLFLCELADTDALEAEYPDLHGKLRGQDFDIPQYLYDDAVDVSNKSVVVDWYYKRKSGGRTVLHYAKLCGGNVLYASENDPRYAGRGWYDHGRYPFFADVLFPEVGTPVGFGYVAVCKDPQIYIDKLFSNILETSTKGTRRRYFISQGVDANEAEILDENNPFVHVSGPLGEDRLRELVTRPLDSVYLNVIQLKIDELNKTASNRDVNNGGAGSSVTAASAIAALQEAGNKTSRDMIGASYRVHTEIAKCCVELMRQFYTVERTFRITNEAPYRYAALTPGMLAPSPSGRDAAGDMLFRQPVFDIRIKAQKRNPFSRAEQNERAKELYGLGFFNPERAQEALAALDMMSFEGVEKVREKIAEGQTLYNMVRQLSEQLMQARALLAAYVGDPGGGAVPGGASGSGGRTAADGRTAAGGRAAAGGSGGRTAAGGSGGRAASGGRSVQRAEAEAQTPPRTPYMDALAARSRPNMNVGAVGG